MMHCIKCGRALPAEVAICPACGAATPYNVTAPPSEDISVKAAAPDTSAEQSDSSQKAEVQPSIAEEPTRLQQDIHTSAPAASLPPPQQSQQTAAFQAPPAQPPPQGAITPSYPGQPWPQTYSAWQQLQAFPAPQGVQPATPLPVPPVAVPSPASQTAPRGISSLARTLLLIIGALLVIGGGGIVYYAAFGHPGELRAHATAVAQDFLTAQTPAGIYSDATSGKPALYDPLNTAKNSTWSESNDTGNSCTFRSGAYHLSVPGSNTATQCLSTFSNVGDFAFQVQMTIVQGTIGGLLFRISGTHLNYYAFDIENDGFYRFIRFDGVNQAKLLSYGPSPAIHTALDQANLLTVVAHNNIIYLYINKQFVASAVDNTYLSGGIGLFAVKGTASSVDIAFSNVQVWKL